MIHRFITAVLVCFVFLVGCKKSEKNSELVFTENLDSLFADYQTFKLEINPIEASKAGYSKYNDTVADYISDDYQNHLLGQYNNFLERIKEVDTNGLGQTQKLALGVMEWDCDIKKEGLLTPLTVITSPIYNLPTLELFPLGQIQSLHLYVAQLAGGTSVHPFITQKDYDDWLRRIEDYLAFLDTSMDKMKEGVQNDIVLPKALVVKMIPQLEDFVSASIEDHLFYQPILNIPDDFSEATQERLSSAYTAIISEKIIPKYAELKTFLKEEYLPKARATSGIDVLANGKETYDYLIRLHTTTNMTADEIHELGKSEVVRIRGEMEEAMSQIGFKGDLMAFFEHVRSNKSLMPFKKPKEVIAHFKLIEKKIEEKLDSVFNLRPKAGFEVRRTETFREASASAEYVPGSKDASRPGVFYVPIPDVTEFNILTSEALFLHEAVPGHHFQLSLQQENADLPEFLHPESMGVFVEGWALYAESLGKELGLYDDPYQYFGMLSMEMHRAIRLVVDTGLHAKGWTREQAIQYSLENEADSEAGITAEIERYMATPGQALSYKIGQLKIGELRNKAEAALGADFNVGDFHDQVLNSGSLPLILLEKKIHTWIEQKKESD
ncbi:DUF885 domain-containing protein [Croceitalea rosinachiae]|uniref:DUF885 domain-containing protein n=1 Tax=Croceitalea rosinachiae TaxID=3075596 RepID=A0ABU3AE54_9FLAO|nr:DUF885 domain-containing protein [Croceitalea sp. F388]MDT0608075.1 DUF885 domain-containing protein [Croceitalea sp. F388]